MTEETEQEDTSYITPLYVMAYLTVWFALYLYIETIAISW